MFPRLPKVTKVLLIANGVAYLAQLLLGSWLDILMLWPLGPNEQPSAYSFMPWQLLTYGFLHDNPAHLIFNMLALVMFGAPLEYEWRARRFATYYIVCVVGAALCQLLVGWWTLTHGGQAYATLGASGGIFGLLLAFGLLYPNAQIAALPFPIFFRARTLVIIYAVLELLLGLNGRQPGVAHFAHLGGMLFGWLLIRYWRRPRPPKRPGPRKPRHLRIVR